MFFLILSIVTSAMISVVMRLSQGKTHAQTSLLAANYLTCTVCGLCYTGIGSFTLRASGMGMTLGMGALNGFIYVASLMLTQYNVRRSGVVLQSVFSKIGALLVPLLLAILAFGERPGVLQILGSIIAVGAILAMNLDSKQNAAGSMGFLLLTFLVDGLVGAMSKIYDETGESSLSSYFLLFTFGIALILCTITLLVKKERPGFWELAFGIMIGVPNYFSSRFLLRALATVPAVVAYPLRSVGGIVVVALAGLFLFRERLRKAQWFAIGAIMLAVVFLSV